MVFHASVLLQSLCLQFQWEFAKPVLPPIELQLQHAFTESRKLTADFTKCCRFIKRYQFGTLMRPPSCHNPLMCHPGAVLETRFLPLADCIRPAESGTAGKDPENVLAAESGTARRSELKKVQHMRRQVERPWPGHARGERLAAGHRADGPRQRGGRTTARLSERAENTQNASRPSNKQTKAQASKDQESQRPVETDEAARLSPPRATNTGPGFASLRQRESPGIQGTQQKQDPGLGGSGKEGTRQHSARSGRDLRQDERPRNGTFEPKLKTNMNAVDESEITPPPTLPPPPAEKSTKTHGRLWCVVQLP